VIIRASEEYRGGPVGRSRANRDVSPNTDSLFFPEGEYWTIAYEGQTCRLRDSKGLRYLAHLLRHPAERFSAADLIATDDSTRRRTGEPSDPRTLDPPDPERARTAVTKRIRAAVQKIAQYHPSLGYHLSTAVKTGQTCVYLPDPTRPMAWRM
jgi:hypothetical protein